MKNSLVLIFLSVLVVQYNDGQVNAPVAVEMSLKDGILVEEKCLDTVTNKYFPWSSDQPCELGSYNANGIIPAMYDSLVALSLEERLTNGLNLSKARSNYHGVDCSLDGVDYSAAIDISIRCLTEDDIRDLLDELSMKGFAGWYRKKGEDGWKGDDHIHAIWVASPLKQQLVVQVKKWLLGRNGLASDKSYEFWRPQAAALKRIRLAFNQSNPS